MSGKIRLKEEISFNDANRLEEDHLQPVKNDNRMRLRTSTPTIIPLIDITPKMNRIRFQDDPELVDVVEKQKQTQSQNENQNQQQDFSRMMATPTSPIPLLSEVQAQQQQQKSYKRKLCEICSIGLVILLFLALVLIILMITLKKNDSNEAKTEIPTQMIEPSMLALDVYLIESEMNSTEKMNNHHGLKFAIYSKSNEYQLIHSVPTIILQNGYLNLNIFFKTKKNHIFYFIILFFYFFFTAFCFAEFST